MPTRDTRISIPPPISRGLQTFAAEADRARLTPAAIIALRNLAKEWKIKRDNMAALLGVSPSTWDRIYDGKFNSTFSQDQFTRVSALIGIFKGMRLLFANDMADRWINYHNSGPLFGNKTPIQTMIDGGIPIMLDVRRYVDALRGGL